MTAPRDRDDGFAARWSRRKLQAREGRLMDDPAPRGAVDDPAAKPVSTAAAPAAVHPAVPLADRESAPPAPPASPPAAEPRREPAPTLQDVAALTRESDFSRFVAPGVDEGVKRAALKKLFSDPRFNVMDGLDTYIDDYNKADPLPAPMLRKMAQSAFLGLFREDDENADLQLQPDHAAGRPGAGEGDGAPGDGQQRDGEPA
jgi:hypothetical protein